MANQQLIDYVKGQMMAGVGEADIKKILKDAGWPDTEIEEGVKGAKPAQPAVSAIASSPVSAQSVQPKMAEPMKQEVKPAEPKKESMGFDFMSNPTGMSSMSSSPASAKVEKKVEPIDASMAAMSAAATGKSSLLPWIITGVSLLLLIGGGLYLYNANSSLSTQISQLTAAGGATGTQLSDAQRAAQASADEATAARADAAETLSELSLFVLPPNASGTLAAIDFTLKGTVGQAKAQFTFTTAKGLILYVKNSKDAKVDFNLKPLIGATAELSGTHVPGTYDITVAKINGTTLDALPAAATTTSSQSTSTAPKFTGPGGTTTTTKP